MFFTGQRWYLRRGGFGKMPHSDIRVAGSDGKGAAAIFDLGIPFTRPHMQTRLDIIDFDISPSGENIHGPDFRLRQLQYKLRSRRAAGLYTVSANGRRSKNSNSGGIWPRSPFQSNFVTVNPLDDECTLIRPDTDGIKSGYRPCLFYLCHIFYPCKSFSFCAASAGITGRPKPAAKYLSAHLQPKPLFFSAVLPVGFSGMMIVSLLRLRILFISSSLFRMVG